MTLTILGLLSIALTVGFTCYTYFGASGPSAGQSRRASLIEAWTNVAIGFGINYLANIFILPLVGAHIDAASNFWLGCIYTSVSVLRSFVIRRWFNLRAFSERIAGALA